MDSLNRCIMDYTYQLRDGQIQRAYRGILAFLASLRSNLAEKYPEYAVSMVYAGYLDMSYFAFTPLAWKQKGLKIAIVYLHQQNRFEGWLGAANRAIQKEYFERFSVQDVGSYRLTRPRPGVDSILVSVLDDQPDFDRTEELGHRIEAKAMAFIADMETILNKSSHRDADYDKTGGEKQ